MCNCVTLEIAGQKATRDEPTLLAFELLELDEKLPLLRHPTGARGPPCASRITARKHGINEDDTRSNAARAVQSIPAYVEAGGIGLGCGFQRLTGA